MTTKSVLLDSEKTRSGKLRIAIPENWNPELITNLEFQVNRDMNYIDTIYYKGSLLYEDKQYQISGAMCLFNSYPQTPGFYFSDF